MRANTNLDVGALFARVTSFSVRRASLVVGIALLVSLAGLALALTLDAGRTSSAGGEGGGDAAAATKDLRAKFGDDPVVVLVRGRLSGMLLTEDVARMLSLEGCISGNVPRGATPAAPVCSEFARKKPVQVVYGPGTFINEAANQVLDRINFDRGREAIEANRAAREARRVARRRGLSPAQQEQFAQEARRIVAANYAQRALELAVRFGLSSVPALNNPEFVLQLVFEPSLGAEVPKPRFAYLFPHSDAAVIQARLRPGLTNEERGEAVAMIKEAVGAKPFDLKFGSYVVSGSPVVAEGVAASLSDAVPALVVAALLLVTVVLLLASRHRPVLLPLAVGAGAAAITLGGVRLLGGSLSAGVAAALPVLGALGAGWALQLQAGLGARPPEGARTAGPALALGLAATGVAFLVLLLSPVSLAREFGAVVAIGLLVVLVLSLTAGAAVLGGREQLVRRLAPLASRLPRRRLPPGRTPRLSLGRLGSLPATIAQTARARPGRILRIGVALALLGFVAATQIDVTSDEGRLLGTDRVEARDLTSIERETGTPGDVNLIVRSDRLLDPEVVRWMSSYQRRVLRQNGFREGRPCGEADLCPALSLTNLFGGGRQTARQIRRAVNAMPRYFSQNVITRDRRTANVAFRLGAMPPAERREVIDGLRAELDPPAGVEAQLAGPVVVAADGESDLERSLWLVTIAALLLVTGLAAAVSRSAQGALLVGLPLTLAAGWTLGILFLLPVDVDFLTAALAAVVVAVASGPIALASRGHPPGRDSLAFGAVAVAGFLALTASDIPALRDFGAAGAVAVAFCGAALAVTVAAMHAWLEARGGVRMPRSRAELAGAGRTAGAAVGGTLQGTAAGVGRGVAAVRQTVPRAGRRVWAAVTPRR